MAKDIFPRKDAGQRMSASHLNDLSEVAERHSRTKPGSNMFGVNRGVVLSHAAPKPWIQRTLIVTNRAIDADDTESSGLYLVKMRYYDHGFNPPSWRTDDIEEYILDAREFGGDQNGITYDVDDKLTGYWDYQRQSFIPIPTPERCRSLSDFQTPRTGEQLIEPRDGSACSTFEFALEISQDKQTWRTVNGRVYSIALTEQLENREPTNPYTNVFASQFGGSATNNCRAIKAGVSGTGIYTFRVYDSAFLRVVVRHNNADIPPVVLDFAALRLEGKCDEAIRHSTSDPLEDGVVITRWNEEALVDNQQSSSKDPLDKGVPSFVATDNSLQFIRVETPYRLDKDWETPLPGDQDGDEDTPIEKEAWTIEAELSVKIRLAQSGEYESDVSSGGSSQSVSSQGTSESSASTQSASSESSQRSSSSGSSQSQSSASSQSMSSLSPGSSSDVSSSSGSSSSTGDLS